MTTMIKKLLALLSFLIFLPILDGCHKPNPSSAHDPSTECTGKTSSATKIPCPLGAVTEHAFKDVPKINGRIPINSGYRNQVFPKEKLSKELAEKYPNSVKFKDNGFPDFMPYRKGDPVTIKMTGNRQKDEALANLEAHFDKTPKDYTWHHMEDCATMILVPTDIHRAIRHTGGFAVVSSAMCP